MDGPSIVCRLGLLGRSISGATEEGRRLAPVRRPVVEHPTWFQGAKTTGEFGAN